MIRCRVNPRLEARITLPLVGKDGRTLPVELLIDTGFGGEISLPHDIVGTLGWESLGDYVIVLANGQEMLVEGWDGRVMWHDRPRSVLVLESAVEPLLGMNLMWRSRLCVDVRANGPVVIEELG